MKKNLSCIYAAWGKDDSRFLATPSIRIELRVVIQIYINFQDIPLLQAKKEKRKIDFAWDCNSRSFLPVTCLQSVAHTFRVAKQKLAVPAGRSQKISKNNETVFRSRALKRLLT